MKAGGLPSMRAETRDRCEENRLQLLGRIQKDLLETEANTQEIMLALNITPPTTTTPMTTPTTCPDQSSYYRIKWYGGRGRFDTLGK